MYTKPPSTRELAAWELAPEDVEGEPLDVWPDCWPAVQLMMRMRTQWRMGFGGASGLDYAVMFLMMDRMHLQADDYDALEDDLRVMEAEALAVMHEGN